MRGWFVMGIFLGHVLRPVPGRHVPEHVLQHMPGYVPRHVLKNVPVMHVPEYVLKHVPKHVLEHVLN